MGSDTMPNKRTALILALLACASLPLRAQVDLTGQWSPRVYNDHMDIGDYTGIPLNDAARLRAESFHPEQLDLPENLCRPHPIDVGLRVSVSQLQITNELNPDTREPVGLRLHVAWQDPQQVIFMDGRPHDPKVEQTWLGDSIGHWEGDTLVVDTVGQNDITWIDAAGIPHSTDMKVTERITRTDLGHMEIVHIIDDPKTFSRPWTFTTKPTLLKGELIEYICQENNKDIEHLVGK